MLIKNQSNLSFYQNQTKINFIKVLIEKYENKFEYQNNLLISSNQKLISLLINHLQNLKIKLSELENKNLITELEIKKFDIIGKINALDNRFEFNEISISKYTEINKEYKKELESIEFDLQISIKNISEHLQKEFDKTFKSLDRFYTLSIYNNFKVKNFNKWKENNKRISNKIKEKDLIHNYASNLYLKVA